MPSTKKIARNVARRMFLERHASLLTAKFDPKTDVHKMMGEILTQQLGITDAPEAFFKKAQGVLMGLLNEKGLKLDLKDEKMYPLLQQAIHDVADEMGLIEK